MNKYLFLVCALSLMNYEIHNAAAAAQSSTSPKLFKDHKVVQFNMPLPRQNPSVLQSQEEMFEFLDYFFLRKTGMIESINRPEFKRVGFYMSHFKNGRNIQCEVNGEDTNLVENYLKKGKKEISQLFMSSHRFARVTTSDMLQFLDIFYCERSGLATFKNSKLFIQYYSEPELSSKAELQQLVVLHNRQLQMHEKMVIHLGVIQKLLEKRQFVSTSVQTEA
ncbi:MAG TPA: hypothetical protein VLG50_03935 [Candidatus Saccharimonadales bacterium]|nr:hypothetical protein [Candidatus Saccharimonadales bacterium]